jgi:hypothetical protein
MKEALSEVIILALIYVVPLFIGKAFAWWKARENVKTDTAYSTAVEALEVGVNDAWERWGRALKAAHADGKFTDIEREDLRTKAKDIGIEVGREQGVDLLKVLGERSIALLIRKIVAARK